MATPLWRLPSGAARATTSGLGDAAKPSHKELLRQAIDRALAQKPASLEGAAVPAGTGRLYRSPARQNHLHRRGGAGATTSALTGWGTATRWTICWRSLSGQKEHTPRKKTAVQTAPPKVNLLVDIQAKLQAGKRRRVCSLGQGVQPQTDGPDPQLPV